MSAADEYTGEVGALLRRLVAAHVAPDRRDSVLRVVNRLLGSSLSAAPSMQTAESLSHAMLFRLVREGRHVESTKLAELTAGLRFERGLKPDAVWPVLYVLNELRGSGNEVVNDQSVVTSVNKHDVSGTDDDLGSSPPSTEIVGESNQSYVNASDARGQGSSLPPVSVNPFQTGIEPAVNQHEDVVLDSEDDDDDFFILSRKKSSRAASQSREAPKSSPKASPKKQLGGTVTPLQNKSLERALVEDLLMVVQGESGKILSFNPLDESETVSLRGPSGAEVAIALRDMVMYIAEIGFLFRVIRERVDDDNTERSGLVARNLCSSIIREMDTYYRSLVTLRNSERVAEGSGENYQRGLSLRKLYVWAEAEKPRLRWLARLCEETKDIEGGRIVAHLRLHRGSYLPSDIHDTMSRILQCTSAPINRMLLKWLSEGALADEFHEFFIMEDPKVVAASRGNPYSIEEVGVSGGLAGGPNSASAASQRIWWGLFKIRKEQLPGCLDKDLAQKALIAGKSIAFLRRCCSDSGWVDRQHAPLIAKLSAGKTKLFEADPRFEDDTVRTLIESAKDSSSKRLKALFFDRFDLSHHFGAIKNYLLLSQGDFSQALMDGLASILDGGADILRNNLTGIVDAALQGCSSYNEETDQDILERLDVQIAQHGKEADVGWDVFSLTYRVEDAPLNTVFSPKVMDAYLLIFRLLWRLKRMDHLMNLAYLNLCAFGDPRRLRRNANRAVRQEMAALGRRAHLVRMKMTHFVQIMQHYCTVEVLEGSWTILERDINSAEDLDGMIHAHSVYLTRIKDRTLLSDRSKYVASELNAVLNVIPLFDLAQKELCQWTNSNGGSTTHPDETEVDGMKEKLEDIENTFNESLDKFLTVLRKHSRMVDSCVFLLFRLDFNQHYSRRTSLLRSPHSAGSPESNETSGRRFDG